MAQIIELVLFAALAAVVLYQLYNVLGKRTDDDSIAREQEKLPPAMTIEPIKPKAPKDGDVSGQGVAAIKNADPQFHVGDFLAGARGAYEMILIAHAKGDKDALKGLLNADMFDDFVADIDARKADGDLEAIEIINEPRAEIEGARVVGRTAQIDVGFKATIRPEDAEGDPETVEDIWVFERDIDSPDPNWTLIETKAVDEVEE